MHDFLPKSMKRNTNNNRSVNGALLEFTSDNSSRNNTVNSNCRKFSKNKIYDEINNYS